MSAIGYAEIYFGGLGRSCEGVLAIIADITQLPRTPMKSRTNAETVLRLPAFRCIPFFVALMIFAETARSNSRIADERTFESLHRAVAEADYAINPLATTSSSTENGYVALNPAQALTARFGKDEVLVSSTLEQNWQIKMKLRAYGRGTNLVPLTSGKMRTQGSRLEIDKHSITFPERSALTEWYINTPGGLEQGFIIPAPPSDRSVNTDEGQGDLLIALEITGDLQGELRGDGQAIILRDGDGRHVATYKTSQSLGCDRTGISQPGCG